MTNQITLLQTYDKRYRRYRTTQQFNWNSDATRIERAFVHVNGNPPVYISRIMVIDYSGTATTNAPVATFWRGTYTSGGQNAFTSSACKLWSDYPDANPGVAADGGMNIFSPVSSIVATRDAQPILAVGGASVASVLSGFQTVDDALDLTDYIVLDGDEALLLMLGPTAVGTPGGLGMLTLDWFQFNE